MVNYNYNENPQSLAQKQLNLLKHPNKYKVILNARQGGKTSLQNAFIHYQNFIQQYVWSHKFKNKNVILYRINNSFVLKIYDRYKNLAQVKRNTKKILKYLKKNVTQKELHKIQCQMFNCL